MHTHTQTRNRTEHGAISRRSYLETAARPSLEAMGRTVREATTAAAALLDWAVASRSEKVGCMRCDDPGREPLAEPIDAAGEKGRNGARSPPVPLPVPLSEEADDEKAAGLASRPFAAASPLPLAVALGGRLPPRAGGTLTPSPPQLPSQAALLLLPCCCCDRTGREEPSLIRLEVEQLPPPPTSRLKPLP